MTKVNESLSLALDVPFEKQEILEPVKQEKPVEEQLTSDADADYHLARNTFRNLITQGNLAMDDMQNLARESESPRAYEVFATMMKTISETTKDLFDLQQKTKELKEVSNKTPRTDGSIHVEKAVFIGTTAELLKRIKEEKNNENI
jgi:hypothetical protein